MVVSIYASKKSFFRPVGDGCVDCLGIFPGIIYFPLEGDGLGNAEVCQ